MAHVLHLIFVEDVDQCLEVALESQIRVQDFSEEFLDLEVRQVAFLFFVKVVECQFEQVVSL